MRKIALAVCSAAAVPAIIFGTSLASVALTPVSYLADDGDGETAPPTEPNLDPENGPLQGGVSENDGPDSGAVNGGIINGQQAPQDNGSPIDGGYQPMEPGGSNGGGYDTPGDVYTGQGPHISLMDCIPDDNTTCYTD